MSSHTIKINIDGTVNGKTIAIEESFTEASVADVADTAGEVPPPNLTKYLVTGSGATTKTSRHPVMSKENPVALFVANADPLDGNPFWVQLSDETASTNVDFFLYGGAFIFLPGKNNAAFYSSSATGTDTPDDAVDNVLVTPAVGSAQYKMTALYQS